MAPCSIAVCVLGSKSTWAFSSLLLETLVVLSLPSQTSFLNTGNQNLPQNCFLSSSQIFSQPCVCFLSFMFMISFISFNKISFELIIRLVYFDTSLRERSLYIYLENLSYPPSHCLLKQTVINGIPFIWVTLLQKHLLTTQNMVLSIATVSPHTSRSLNTA